MVLFNRYLVWVSAALELGLFWLVMHPPLFVPLSRPVLICGTIVLSLLVAFLTVWQLTGRHIKRQQFWIFAITPLLFLAGAWLFLLFIEDQSLRYWYSLAFSVFYLVFIKVVFLYLYRRPKYQPHALDNISNLLNIIAIFLLFSGLFALKLFFGLNVWFIAAVAALVLWALIYQLLSVSDIGPTEKRFAQGVLTVLLFEVFLAVSFLPTSIYVNSAIIMLAYYLMIGLARNWLLDIKDRTVLIRYLLIGLISLFIILLTAKWI